MSKNIEATLDEALVRLKNIEDLLTTLTAGTSPKRRFSSELSDLPADRRDVLRDAELHRIFARLWGMSVGQKNKANFPQYIIQEFGKCPVEIVPQSILVNRCELLKAFYPGRVEMHREPRAVALETLERALKNGTLVRCSMKDVVPATRLDRSGEVVLIVSLDEARRRGLVEDERAAKPWEEAEDWDEEAEDIQPTPPTKKTPAREPWEDEPEETPAPVKKPVVELEGFRSPRSGTVLEGFGRKGGDS